MIEEVSFRYIKVKVKLTHYRSGQALRFARGWGSQISRQSTHEGGEVVSPYPPTILQNVTIQKNTTQRLTLMKI